MRYAYAPMEGITGRTFRELHAAWFSGVDCYCLPFLSPTEVHQLTQKQRQELDPGSLGCSRLLPQILTKSPEDFLWCASAVAELGYREVNLNLGCPSGTVVSKGKGAGMLRDPDALDRFLEAVFAACPIAVSVKTRIGLESPAEFAPILRVLCRYPIHTLTIHPRTRRAFYTGTVDLESFSLAARSAPFPLCFNGNLFTPASVEAIAAAYPGVDCVMLGRGLLADPFLAARCRGGVRDRKALLGFHNALCAAYLETMHPNQAVLPKLKELWQYLALLFPDEGAWKRLRKAKTWAEFYPITQEVLQDSPMLPEADFSRLSQSSLTVLPEINH